MMPVSVKSPVLRVASTASWLRQIAAICASAVPIGRPARSRRTAMSAYAVLEVLDDHGLEQPGQRRLPTPIGQTANAVQQFGQGHRRQVHLVARLSIDPLDDCARRLTAHQLRHDVGVQNDHVDTCGARGASRRDGSSNSAPPTAANRC
jgi:hypothetical protein